MMHPLCTIRLLVLNRSPVLVVIISVICDPQHGDIVLQVDQQHLDWLPYSFSDHVHQNLFFIISHPSLLLPGTILINSFSSFCYSLFNTICLCGEAMGEFVE